VDSARAARVQEPVRNRIQRLAEIVSKQSVIINKLGHFFRAGLQLITELRVARGSDERGRVPLIGRV